MAILVVETILIAIVVFTLLFDDEMSQESLNNPACFYTGLEALYSGVNISARISSNRCFRSIITLLSSTTAAASVCVLGMYLLRFSQNVRISTPPFHLEVRRCIPLLSDRRVYSCVPSFIGRAGISLGVLTVSLKTCRCCNSLLTWFPSGLCLCRSCLLWESGIRTRHFDWWSNQRIWAKNETQCLFLRAPMVLWMWKKMNAKS